MKGVDGKDKQGSYKQKRQSKCKKCPWDVYRWKYSKETAGGAGTQTGASREQSVKHRSTTRTVTAGTQRISRETRRNREKAMSMGRGFVTFLAVVSVAVLFCCVNYLQLKAELTGRIKSVAGLESEWAQLKEENDAYESQVTSEVDLDQIREIAIGRLGMNYPTDSQKKTYSVPSSSYVRQYQDVP